MYYRMLCSLSKANSLVYCARMQVWFRHFKVTEVSKRFVSVTSKHCVVILFPQILLSIFLKASFWEHNVFEHFCSQNDALI